jgi:hypothetical protein
MELYESVCKSFRTESITKYTLTTINTRREATQRVMAAKLSRLTQKIEIQLHLVAESCIFCSSCFRRPVRKLLVTPLYFRFPVRFLSWCLVKRRDNFTFTTDRTYPYFTSNRTFVSYRTLVRDVKYNSHMILLEFFFDAAYILRIKARNLYSSVPNIFTYYLREA